MKFLFTFCFTSFFLYWLVSLKNISTPEFMIQESPYGKTIIIVPIDKDHCQIQVLDGEKLYVKNVKWIWCLTQTKLRSENEDVAYLGITKNLYFYFDGFENIKSEKNIVKKTESNRKYFINLHSL